MSDRELSLELSALWAREQAIAARRLEVIAEVRSRDLARKDGATSLTAWLIGKLRVTGGRARQMIELACALGSSCQATAAALAAGVVNEQQAVVIGKAVTDLADTGPVPQAKAEELMLSDEFTIFEPHTLRKLGGQVLNRVDPALAEKRQRAQLDDADRKAARDRALCWSAFGDGTGRHRLTAVFGAEAAAIIQAAMEPLCSPAGPHDDRTATQRRADALRDVCDLALKHNELPDSGGDAAKMFVTMKFDDLATGVGAATLDNGDLISPQSVRRLACCSGVIPVVLNGHGVPIDVGRERRFYTGAARRALVLRDGGCAFPGCDRPAKWTEGHHRVSWKDGGRTDLSKPVLR